MHTIVTTKISNLYLGAHFIDAASGLGYTVEAMIGFDHVIASADKGKDMVFTVDRDVIAA